MFNQEINTDLKTKVHNLMNGGEIHEYTNYEN